MSRTLVILTFAITASSLSAQECRYEAERTGSVDAANARTLIVEAGSGSLRVEGRPGTTGVQIRGRACASSQELLDQLGFDASRRSDVVEVVTHRMEQRNDWGDRRYARLDLVLEVPAGIAARIEDGSGSMVLRDLGETRVQDGSGSIDVAGISGHLEVIDGSGDITIRDVRGDVTIEDGSGRIDVQDVDGGVSIDDGSGEISVTRTARSVRIDDSSGGIRVSDIGGDFIVARNGSGRIRHDGVRGVVDIPRQR